MVPPAPKRHRKTAAILLAHGANPGTCDASGLSAAALASANGKANLRRLFGAGGTTP